MAKNEKVNATQKDLGLDENKKSMTKSKKDKKAKANKAPKKNKAKETVSELKKVTWPKFGTVVKNTGMVLAVVLIFGLLVFGIDSLFSWLIKLIMKI